MAINHKFLYRKIHVAIELFVIQWNPVKKDNRGPDKNVLFRGVFDFVLFNRVFDFECQNILIIHGICLNEAPLVFIA